MPEYTMAEIIHFEGSECIEAHFADAYESDYAIHNRPDLRHGFRQSMRFQLTEKELDSLAEEGSVNAEAVKHGTEIPLGNYLIVGCNGQLGDEDIVLDGQRYLLSGNLCKRLKQEGYVEKTSAIADISLLIKKA